jgi:hypothetical protein
MERVQGLKQVMREKTPVLMTWLKKRRRLFVNRERAGLFAQSKRDGASAT